MAVVTNLPRTYNDQSMNRASAVDMSGMQYCAVALTGGATGRATATTPSGQGVLTVGIQQNVPSSTVGSLCEILERGYSQVRAFTTFNAGVELTVHDFTGRLEAAASGDFVIAISEEASTCTDAMVTARIIDPYQKN